MKKLLVAVALVLGLILTTNDAQEVTVLLNEKGEEVKEIK